MVKSNWFIPIAAAIVLTACSVRQQVTMAPIELNLSNSGSEFYQASYTRTTDILHMDLNIGINWDSASVRGKAYLTAKPYFYPLDNVVLDARGFTIHEVSLVTEDQGPDKNRHKKALNYAYDGKKLSVNLDSQYTRDRQFMLYIDYTAMPNKLVPGKDISSPGDRGMYFINREGKDKEVPRQVWTQGEPESNASWFPCISGPQEKLTQDISITVPENMVTLSNGELDFSTSNSNGTRTDNWRLDKPHSSYLTMIAAGDFVVTRDKWKNMEVSYYMEPKYAPYARLIFGKTPEMLQFFSDKTGINYPWDKYSQIVVRDFVSGAMENTTATVFFDKLNLDEGQYQDENYEDVIAHELFHHWFGDLVTCESWANLPLNESFATYGEYLWDEFKYGKDYADYRGLKDMQTYMRDPFSKTYSLIRFDYSDKEQMFDNVSYEKGERILHMLRKTVGDDAFFKALNLYLNRFAYKTAEVHDLRLVFEEVTGQDLNWFFKQWFLAPGHPKLSIESKFDAAAGKVYLSISQLHEHTEVPAYRIPLSVDIYSDGKVERKEIVLEKQNQTFIFPAAKEPDLVNADAEKYVLAEKIENKTPGQYRFQYEHAPLFMDRYEAVMGLIAAGDKKAAGPVLLKALNDKNWYIRKIAVDFVAELNSNDKDEAFPVISKLAVSDERSYVRAAAITALNKTFKMQDNRAVMEKAKNDKAPSVIKALGGW